MLSTSRRRQEATPWKFQETPAPRPARPNPMTKVRPHVIVALAAALCLGAPSSLRAQVMEPLSYTNAPIGLNFLIAGYGYLCR